MNALTTQADMQAIRQQYGLTEAEHETQRWEERGRHRFGVSWRQGYRTAWWDGVEWLLNLQHDYENLTNSEVVAELRKGPASIYWPLKADDPKAWLLCDHCRTRQLFDARGICDHCGTETE